MQIVHAPRSPEQQHVTVAQGYVELGMYLDADAELDQIDPEVRHLPEVIAVRIEIYKALERWELLQTVSKRGALYDPDAPQWTVSWAYATRRADSIEAARLILVDAVEPLPNIAIFHYNSRVTNANWAMPTGPRCGSAEHLKSIRTFGGLLLRMRFWSRCGRRFRWNRVDRLGLLTLLGTVER